MSDIRSRLLLDAKQYDDSLKKSKKGSDDFASDVAGKLSGAVAKFAAGIGVAVGGVEAFNKIMGSSQTLGDTWNNTINACKGTVDAFFLQEDKESFGKVIHIFDFKAMSRGMGCDLFPQLKGYALGVASLLHIQNTKTKVVLHLLLGGSFKHEILETDVFDCITTGETIVNDRKHAETAAHCPSEWCKYCRHSSNCPATDEAIEIVESGKLGSLDVCHRLVFIEQLSDILSKAKEECKSEIARAKGKCIDCGDVAYVIREQNGRATIGEGKMWELYETMTTLGVSLEDLFDKCTIKKSDAMKLLQKTTLVLLTYIFGQLP